MHVCMYAYVVRSEKHSHWNQNRGENQDQSPGIAYLLARQAELINKSRRPLGQVDSTSTVRDQYCELAQWKHGFMAARALRIEGEKSICLCGGILQKIKINVKKKKKKALN